MASLQELILKISAKKDASFSSSLNGATAEVKSQSKSMQTAISALAPVAMVAGAAIIGIGAAAIKASTDYNYLKKQLELISGSAEIASKRFAELEQMAMASGKFTLEQFVFASNAMENFKTGSSALLPAVAGLAEAIGTDLNGAAITVNRAISGDARALLTLERQLGVSKAKLKDFNSDFDLTGENAERNGQIIKEFFQERYGDNLAGTAETAKSAFGTLQLSIKGLTAEFGDSLEPTVISVANKLIGLTQSIRNMDPVIKGMTISLAGATLAASGFIIVASKLAQTLVFQQAIAGVKTLGMALTSLNAGYAGLAGTISLGTAGIVAGFGLAVVAGIAFNEMLKEQIRLSEELSDNIQKHSKAQHDGTQAIKKYTAGQKLSADELASAIVEAQNRISSAISMGASPEVIKRQRELLQNLRNIREAGEFEGKTKSAPKETAIEETQTTAQTEDEKLKIWIDAQTQRLKIAKDYQGQKKALNQMGLSDEINYLKRILATYYLTADQRKQIAFEIQRLEKQIRDKNLQDIEDDEAKKKALLEQKLTETERIQDEINKLTMSESDYALLQTQKRVEELRKAGVDEVKISEWVAAKKKELTEKTTTEVTKSVEQQKRDISDLERQLNNLVSRREGGASSPLISMEELGVRSSMAFAGKNPKEVIDQAQNIQSGLTVSKTEGAGQAASVVKNTVSDSNYNITINKVQIGGNDAKDLVNIFKRNGLVNPKGINRSESVEY